MERGREKRGREGENSLRNQWQYHGQIKNEGEKNSNSVTYCQWAIL